MTFQSPIKVQMPNPTSEDLAKIRRLLPQKTNNTESLTDEYLPLLHFLEDELVLDVSAEYDQHVYAAGWSILWCARNSQLQEIESAYENAVELRQNGDGGGHAALMHALGRLGYKVTSSTEAERVAEAVIRGQL